MTESVKSGKTWANFCSQTSGFSGTERKKDTVNTDPRSYGAYVKKISPKSPVLRDCVCAFLAGGVICCIAEGFYRLYLACGMSENNTKILVSVTMFVLSAAATCAGVFDKIANYAGAGTLVPITGFANAVVSPALDNRSEGLITGVGAKMFVIAGPVIVYGTLASAAWGVLYYFLHRGGIV